MFLSLIFSRLVFCDCSRSDMNGVDLKVSDGISVAQKVAGKVFYLVSYLCYCGYYIKYYFRTIKIGGPYCVIIAWSSMGF